jgi:hypothetical protein
LAGLVAMTRDLRLTRAEPPGSGSWILRRNGFGALERYDLREVHLDGGIACAAAALPPIHRTRSTA